MQETADILIADYEREYLEKEAGAEDLIFMGGRKTVSLNGNWNYTIDPYDTCLRQKWFKEIYFDQDGRPLPVDYSFEAWEKVILPCSMNLVKPEYFWYEGPFVFTRTFEYELNKIGKGHVFLRIGAANYICRVFLNGQYMGYHRGGSTPFMLEVTDALKEENRIILVADNTRKHNYLPTENTDWFNYSGIYRDIELVELPESYIKEFRISLKPGSSMKMLRSTILLNNESAAGTVKVDIPELAVEKEIEIRDGSGEIEFVTPENLELWSPDQPKLYTVKVSFVGKNSEETATDIIVDIVEDTVEDTVGFREIDVRGNDIYLNGEKIFLRGISVHEDSEITGKALTEEERKEIVSAAKELGANYLRLAHYPHHENMAKLCDREGLLLWEEIPVYWAVAFRNADTYRSAENQLGELMRRDYNRASVIIWSVGNENPDADERFRFMGKLADYAHQYDDTRMVSAACLVDQKTLSIKDRLADKLDIIGINEYVGWYSPNFDELPAIFENSHPTKPVIVTEFGADALAGYHGTIDEKGTEECQAEVYRRQIRTLRSIPYIKGMTPWILFDFRCPRRTSVIQKFWNRKGLVAADRKYRKPAFAVLQEFYKRIIENDSKR